jgi:MoxR-like ATPase
MRAPDDIKQVAVPALAHRLTLWPELWVRQVSADDVMAKLLIRAHAEDRPGPRPGHGRHRLMSPA